MGLKHKEFEKAGKKTGRQIWRIEKMELAEVPEALHGSFFVGDAYIILNTVDMTLYKLHNLHFWLGKFQKKIIGVDAIAEFSQGNWYLQTGVFLAHIWPCFSYVVVLSVIFLVLRCFIVDKKDLSLCNFFLLTILMFFDLFF